MSDYADAVRDWPTLNETLQQAYREPEPRFLPAVVQQPAVVQRIPVAPPERPYDPWPLRLGVGSVFVMACGTAVYIACAGLHEAGPFLPWLAGSLGAGALLVLVVKARSSSGVRIGNVTMGDGANFQAGQQR
jgi:hypothetical protein